jgi:hypothetical protein
MTGPDDKDRDKTRAAGDEAPDGRKGLGEPGEHPLSVLIFAPLRTRGGTVVILVTLVVACLGLAVADILLSREGGHGGPGGFPAFYGLLGFFAFTAAVLSGWVLGPLLRRREDIYERKPGDQDNDDFLFEDREGRHDH